MKRIALKRRRTPLIAYNFNLGQLYGGNKKRIARLALESVNTFVVHSRQEIKNYSEWLSLPAERFKFVPLQVPQLPLNYDEDKESPFILSMGSANRDYKLFLDVIGSLPYQAKIVAAPHALEGLKIPKNVLVYNSLTRDQCHELSQRARINVIPISNTDTASGQVTLIEAMGLGRATIATSCVGTEDYAQNDRTALLVRPQDSDDMTRAIQSLWQDSDLRASLGSAAKIYAEAHFSDQAAGRYLEKILDEQAKQL